jgi:cytochrome c biogenesis protein CcmG, thiol:disulfide interchange protein DsbE
MRKIWIVAAVVVAMACAKSERPAADSKQSQKGAPETVATATESSTPEARVGEPMPAYTAALLDGSTFDVQKERGNVVLLNLWATWCGPCRYEIPELEKLHADLGSQKFKVVGVSVDEGSVDDVRQFVADQKMTYPVAHDPDGRLAVLLQTMSLPTSILLDRKGVVVWKEIGIVDPSDEKFRQAVDAALKG